MEIVELELFFVRRGTWCSSVELDTIAFSLFHENLNSITRIICISDLYHKKITGT